LVASDCMFSKNTANTSGGAVYAFGGSKTTLERCLISGNSAPNGGGIETSNYLLIENCTLTTNSSPGAFGGAVSFGLSSGGTMIVRNSTISGNSSAGGGGIALHANSTLTIQNCTIDGNSVSTAGRGGGVSQLGSPVTISVESSVVSGNTASGGGPDIYCTSAVNVKTSAIGSANGFAETDQGGNLAFQPFANLKLGPL